MLFNALSWPALSWNVKDLKKLQAAFNDELCFQRQLEASTGAIDRIRTNDISSESLAQVTEWCSNNTADDHAEPCFSQFLLAVAEQHLSVPPSDNNPLVRAFKELDLDDNGYISRGELKSVMDELGLPTNAGSLDRQIADADVDGDGQINFAEFLVQDALIRMQEEED